MAKRNDKTRQAPHRPFGADDPEDSFLPPDRMDQSSDADAATPVETINFKTGEAEVAAGDEADPGLAVAEAAARARKAEQEGEPPPRERPARRAAAEDDADDDRIQSNAMRKRIARERAITNREKALREQAETQLRNERVARQATDDRLLKLERSQKVIAADTDVKSLEAKIEGLVPRITAATEAGETKTALSLQIELGQLQTDLAVLKYDLKLRGENAAAITQREADQRAADAARGVGTDQQIEPGLQAENIARGDEWKRQNRHWWRGTKNKDAQEMSFEIDKEILRDVRSGVVDFKPYSEEHFEEMAKRLHEEFPELELCDFDGEVYGFDADEDDDPPVTRRGARQERDVQNRRQAPPPAGRGGSRTRGNRQPDAVEMARQGRVELTQADFNQMRTFNLDPNNPKHKQKFAQERARTLIAESNRGATR